MRPPRPQPKPTSRLIISPHLLLLFIFLLYFVTAPSLAYRDAESAVIHLTDTNFNHHAGTGTWLVLLYSRDKCSSCKAMMRVFTAMCSHIRDGNAPVLQGLGFKCGSVNADVQAAQQLVQRLQPQRLPTLYIMINGKKISEIAGDVSAEALQLSLQSFSSSSQSPTIGWPVPPQEHASVASDLQSPPPPPPPPPSSSPPEPLPPPSTPWWQHWMRADWHLLQLPRSLHDLQRFGTSLRTIGRQLAEGSLQAYTVALVLTAGLFGFTTGVLFVAAKEVGLG